MLKRLDDAFVCPHPHDFHRLWHILACKFMETEENATPDFEFCDLAMTTAPADAKNWHRNHAGSPGEPVSDAHEVLRAKTKFCAFAYSYTMCATRNRFAEILSHHVHVDGGGLMLRSLRHAPPRSTHPRYLWHASVDFYRSYKFVIAFENSLGLHYTSEKLSYALRAHTVPIYWGNPQVAEYFNPERFINAFDFDSLESLARHVVRVHRDDALYMRYLSQPTRTLQQKPRNVIPESSANTFAAFRKKVRAEGRQSPDFLSARSAWPIWAAWPAWNKHHRGFLHQHHRLLRGRALPLAQRGMFHRECLSRFAQGACMSIAEERLTLAGWQRRGMMQRRHAISRHHVWPHPAFYEVVDMAGQLDAKAS